LPLSLSQSLWVDIWDEDIVEFFRSVTGYEPSKKQMEFLQSFQKGKTRILVSSANNGGKTLCLAVIALWSAIFLGDKEPRGVEILMVSGSWTQAKKLHAFIKRFLEHPYVKSRLKGDALITQSEWNNGSKIYCFTGSEKQVYGQHPDIYLIDEGELVSSVIFEDIYSRISHSKYGRVVITATPEPEYYFSKFVEYWLNENGKYNHWLRINWSVLSCPWISMEAIEEARENLSKDKFTAKWMGLPDFNPEGTLFSFEDLKDPEVRIKTKKFDPELPSAIGLDFGFKHPTAIVVAQWQGSYIHILHCEAKSLKTKSYWYERLKKLIPKYNVTRINCDAAVPWLVQDIKNLRLAPTYGITFKGNKSKMQFYLQSLIEHHMIKIPSEFQALYQELSIYTEDTKKKDDRVDALMLSAYKTSNPSNIWYIKSTKRPSMDRTK